MRIEQLSEEQMQAYIKECSVKGDLEVDTSLLSKLIIDGDQSNDNGPDRYFGVYGTKFISISDLGMDFIAFIMCNGPADYVIYCASNSSIIAPGLALGVATAYFIYSELKKVIQLRAHEYCIYKQAVTHFQRHEDFSLEDMREWLPAYNIDQYNQCNMHHNKLFCRHRENDMCLIKKNDDIVLDTMELMIDKGILKSGKRENTFRLNY